ncbi:MAG: pyruvate kinase, partial [Candidatus Humimicrobiaceae bacterium]
MRKAKVVCTIGPACKDENSLRNLILGGMDIARINTSHSDKQEVKEVVKSIRKISKKYQKNTAIMLDLQGPKIRVGELEDDLIIGKGEIVYFTYGDRNFKNIKEKVIRVDYSRFVEDLVEGLSIFIDDGLIECKVLEKTDALAKCKVKRGGILKSHKGINLPDIRISIDSVTDKDIYFLQLGLELEVDFIAQSFVRDFTDVAKIKEIIKTNNSHQMVIAKIEKHEAVDNFNNILKESDGVMVARGDLGIEIDEEDVPIIQKDIIKKANE